MEKTKTKLLASLRETLPEMLEVNPEVYIDNEPEPHFKTTTIQI